MAHRHQIIELEDSDEEGVGGNTAPQQDETMEQGGGSTLSGEEAELHLPSPPSLMRGTRLSLLDLLNDAEPGPSTSRLIRPLPKRLSPPSSSAVPQSPQDDKLRRILCLPPYDCSQNSKVEDKITSTPDEDGPSVKATKHVPKKQLISEYQCPICFCPPTYSCLTTCGHVMCAQCLFSSVRAARERHVRLYGRGPGPDGEGKVSRCPVCRAVMKGWDGRGGGVIGLKMEMKDMDEGMETQMQF